MRVRRRAWPRPRRVADGDDIGRRGRRPIGNEGRCRRHCRFRNPSWPRSDDPAERLPGTDTIDVRLVHAVLRGQRRGAHDAAELTDLSNVTIGQLPSGVTTTTVTLGQIVALS